jgi:peptidoglycan/LPS O-acetylase OafA/YrhL
MPVPVPSVSGSHRYLPALDGLRAFAVAGVIAYHFGFHWANGGYLGVDFFFVLSGFLITSLLAGEWVATRQIRLRQFWARRAKRLLPAVLLLLVVLTLYDWLGGPNIGSGTFRPDAIATLFYYANWHLIFAHQSYFTQFLAPSPLKHTWSLAIEEQFYLVWPLATLAMFGLAKRAGPRGPRPFRRRLALAVSMVVAAASALEMALLYHPGVDPSRIYYGTDTRAFELLIGAVLALLVTARPDHSPRVRSLLHRVGPLAAILLGILWVTAGDDQGNPSAWMYRGGMVIACLLAAAVIASVAQPSSGPLGALLSIPPLRWIGRISYGLYLWHWPVYVLMTDVTTGLSRGALLAARLAATVGAATVSFYLVERPVRRYRWKGWPLTAAMGSAVGITALVVVLGTVPEATAVASSPDYASVRLPAPPGFPDPPPAPIDLPPGQVISPAQPFRVLTIGDSLMFDAELGIAASLESTKDVTVITHGFPGWGLINDRHFADDLAQSIRETHPQLIVGMWSWDNAYALAHPAAYRRLITRAIDVMLTPGNGVDGIAFIQFPNIGPLDAVIDPVARQQLLDRQNAGTRAWTRLVTAVASRYPGRVTMLPAASALDLHGQYSPWLPTVSGGWIRARKTDNTHLCPAGAAVLGAAVTDDLTPMLHLAPSTPGWINSRWTSDTARYGVPPEQCPDDQPPS